MPDMIVKLYNLPDYQVWQSRMDTLGICIRRGMACDKYLVVDWVERTFGRIWASECDVTFSRQPVCCFLATKEKKILGFACYHSSMKNFFGPLGVTDNARCQGIGTTLLLASLMAMKADGYGYAIIGDAGSTDFYEKAVDAQVIAGSTPGIYADRLRAD